MNPAHAASLMEAEAELKQSRDLAQRLARNNAELQDALNQSLQREKALEESETLYQSLVDNLPLRVFRKHAQGRFIFCNRAFCAALKQPPEKLIGKTDLDV